MKTALFLLFAVFTVAFAQDAPFIDDGNVDSTWYQPHASPGGYEPIDNGPALVDPNWNVNPLARDG